MSSSGKSSWPGQGSSNLQGRGRGRGRGHQAPSASSFNTTPGGGARGGGGGRGRGTRGQSFEGFQRGGSDPSSPGPGTHGRGRGRGQPGGAIFMPGRPEVDDRIKDGSDGAAVANLGRSGAAPEEGDRDGGLPLRPDFGTKGRPVVLRTNHFPVDLDPRGEIFQYTAEIALPGSKSKLSRRVKQRVFQLAEQSEVWEQVGMSGRVAHDGAEKLVASFELPQPLTIRGAFHDASDAAPSENPNEFVLTLALQGKVDRELLNACLAGRPVDSQALAKVLSALNLVLTAQPSQTGVKIGRDDDTKKHPDQRLFFDNPDPKDIGGGLTVREGFYVSVRPAHQQLMVNINTSHAAFYKPQNFKNAMEEYHRFAGSNTGAFGRQVRVVTKHNNHVVMIKGISKTNALESKIKYESKLVTIAEFYKRSKDGYLDLTWQRSLITVGIKGMARNCSTLVFRSWKVPMGFRGELTDKKHAKNMLDAACKPPKENANEIVNRGLGELGFRSSNPVLDAFGIHVGTDMAVVPGRILEKPGLSYSAAKPAAIDDRASWNLRNVKFAVGARLDRWAVLVLQDGGRDDFKDNEMPVLQEITGGFRAMCNKSGMQVAPLRDGDYATVRLPARRTRFRDEAIGDIERALVALVARAAPQLVLVMLSNDDNAIYNGLKRLCDVKLDLATVCMQSSKVRKDKREQYYANVALKVNMKLGGINHTLDANSGTWLKSAPTMVMGMDVTHPAKGMSLKGSPSVVAVVASVDGHFAQYPAALAIRESKVEIERDEGEDNVLRDMFISRFQLYKTRNNGRLPERVILYRDGVSESQFVQVRKYELKVMQRALAHFNSARGPYRPKLSIVVCGKRHHTRFYPTQQADAANDGNPLPGTVVDRGVTPAYEFDFFLQAHGGLKGTTRPTHYYVVHDENGFRADTLQRVTHDLSYMFARATKAVSLVSAAYWADVACERGRCYLHSLLVGDKEGGGDPAKGKNADKDKDKGKKGKQPQRREEDAVFEKAVEMWGGGVSGKLRDTMFYL